MIEVNNLTKRFKKGVMAVDNISFRANDGEILGLLGENGAGKTTTLRMLATMLKITEGEVIVNSHNVSKEPDKVRGEIGILFGGEVGLYDRLTARENIKYFAELNGMSKEDTNKSIESIAKSLEMTEYLDRRVGKFSRGMKQKVAIARAIVHNPSVVLFDEPTMGLDVTSAKIVQDFILKCKSDGRCIIFSSHTIPEVEKLCDRIVIIHKGRIVEQGKLKELEEKYNKSIEEIFINKIAE